VPARLRFAAFDKLFEEAEVEKSWTRRVELFPPYMERAPGPGCARPCLSSLPKSVSPVPGGASAAENFRPWASPISIPALSGWIKGTRGPTDVIRIVPWARKKRPFRPSLVGWPALVFSWLAANPSGSNRRSAKSTVCRKRIHQSRPAVHPGAWPLSTSRSSWLSGRGRLQARRRRADRRITPE